MTVTMEPIAVVGVGAIMPEAPDAATFWNNIKSGRYSISDVPPERWDPELYYDPDPHAPDKTYSRIGGWVRDYSWEPLAWKLPIPPAVSAQLDDGQKWAVAGTRAALLDAGWPDWTVDPERVAVIIGNAIGGDKQHLSNLRIQFPKFARDLCAAPSFAALPEQVRDAVIAETRTGFLTGFEEITEDTMPGELANVVAGRVSNLFNFRGPNFSTDAACASALAATSAAVRGLQAGDFDAAVTGGVDHNMDPAGFVKFCKIGALSATGTRPFDAGADGFVMGEGAALFVLKRLSDAERDGDRIYAVLLGLAGSSDGRGKGITAPNPVGQRLAVERAWHGAGVDPASATYIEAHGTSTRVGDATELSSLTDVFRKAGAADGSIALGSVKSNIGHLKGAAGAAGLFKAVLSLHDKALAPSLHFEHPNESVDWDDIPFRVNTELREWPAPESGVRCAGVSAFGFGGTNFHAVLEEYVPGRHRAPDASRSFAGATIGHQSTPTRVSTPAGPKAPLRGAAVVGGADDADVAAQLERLGTEALAGRVPALAAPDPALAGAAVRVAIDYADAGDLAAKAGKAVQALRGGNPAMWKILRAQGVFVGRGAPGKVAFLYTGQGSQYVNMLRDLRQQEALVAATFDEADRVMTPLLGKPLTEYIFADSADEATAQRLEQQLMQTEITQPAVLTTDLALTRMLDAYGVRPDMVMGHSLGEYGALVAAGALSFDAALEAVSARGREMANLAVGDNGAMAAVLAPLGRDRAHRRRNRRVRRRRKHQQHRPGRHRWCHRRGGAGRRGVPGRRHERLSNSGQPCVSHRDRGAGERTTQGGAAPAQRAAAEPADRVERDRRLLPGERRRRHDARICWAARWPHRCGSSTACTRCTRQALGYLSRSGRRRRCTASSRTCSATTYSRCSPTTPRSAMSRRSTRRCAGCTRPGSAMPSRRPSPPLPPPPQLRRPR